MSNTEQGREFEHRDGSRWRVEPISHGRTSDYLNPKVHTPTLQFTCVSRRQPRRYAALGVAATLDRMSVDDLRAVLDRSRTH